VVASWTFVYWQVLLTQDAVLQGFVVEQSLAVLHCTHCPWLLHTPLVHVPQFTWLPQNV